MSTLIGLNKYLVQRRFLYVTLKHIAKSTCHKVCQLVKLTNRFWEDVSGTVEYS